MTGETKLYQLKAGFARRNNMLIYFVAKPLVETAKAYYLYGHGSGETTKKGVCCRCGRTLTHPVSVLLGIGPECGGHWHDWNAVGGYTEENLAKLRILLKDIKIEGWVPKSQVVSVEQTDEKVVVPPDHPKLQETNEVKTQSKPNKIAKMAENKYGERVIQICFPFDYATVDQVRTIPGRKYHGDTKCWSAPIHVESLEKLLSWGFVLSEELITFLRKAATKTREITAVDGIPGLGGELYPFQKVGVSFIEHNSGRALIADEMGLGKTIQALAWLQLHPEKRPAVVVVPASLKLKWVRETEKWISESKVKMLSGTGAHPIENANVIIINYDILADWIPFLQATKPQVLIADECHYFKSNHARRTKAIKMLAKGIPHVIALSGTPIINRPIEAYNAIRIIEPNLFPDPWKFAKRYCAAKYNGFGWDFTGADHTEELHARLVGSIMIRRLKSEVLPDLPAKIHSYVPLTLSNENEYAKAEKNFIAYIRETRGAEAAVKASAAEDLVQIETLKQVSVQGKMAQAVEWVEDFLEVDGKLVMFATHRFVIEALMERFGKVAVKLDGSSSPKSKEEAIYRFQNDNAIRLFVGNIRAAGVGIDLTAASNVAFLELPWTPGDLDQASDRCHRIGQKDEVTIHYLLANGTIEDRIAKILDKKREILNAVLDGKKPDEASMLMELINSYLE